MTRRIQWTLLLTALAVANSVIVGVPPPRAVAGETSGRLVASAALGWPQWRGPRADGVATGVAPPFHWKSSEHGRENVAWTVDIPGNSLSTPVVWGDRIFLMTSVSLDEAAFARIWEKHGFALRGAYQMSP